MNLALQIQLPHLDVHFLPKVKSMLQLLYYFYALHICFWIGYRIYAITAGNIILCAAIKCIPKYIALKKIRKDESFNPTILLQPILGKAFKDVSYTKEKKIIANHLQADNTQFRFTVLSITDNQINQNKYSHIGFINLKKRLELILSKKTSNSN